MADIDYRSRLGFWEKPSTLAVLVIAVASIAGYLGFNFGRQMAQQQRAGWVIQLPPGSVVTVLPVTVAQ